MRIGGRLLQPKKKKKKKKKRVEVFALIAVAADLAGTITSTRTLIMIRLGFAMGGANSSTRLRHAQLAINSTILGRFDPSLNWVRTLL